MEGFVILTCLEIEVYLVSDDKTCYGRARIPLPRFHREWLEVVVAIGREMADKATDGWSLSPADTASIIEMTPCSSHPDYPMTDPFTMGGRIPPVQNILAWEIEETKGDHNGQE